MNWVTVIINGREVSVASDENSIHIYNAYLIKDDLKMRGYRWNPSDKSWFISPGDISSEMEVLKNNLQSSTPTTVPTTTPATVPTSIPAAMPVTKKNGTARTGKKTGTGSGKELSFLPDSCSVADLRNRIDRLIREGIRGNIWVRGIIASDVKNYKWASYLDLKDEDENRD
ncbi:MAG: hypothetical protein GY940_44850, partial [bacterium]|nr:hypothetical protein [bacterium]